MSPAVQFPHLALARLQECDDSSYRDNKTGPSTPLLQRQQDRTQHTTLTETTRQDPAHHSYRDNKRGPSSPLLQRQQEEAKKPLLQRKQDRSQHTTLTESTCQQDRTQQTTLTETRRQDPTNHWVLIFWSDHY